MVLSIKNRYFWITLTFNRHGILSGKRYTRIKWKTGGMIYLLQGRISLSYRGPQDILMRPVGWNPPKRLPSLAGGGK